MPQMGPIEDCEHARIPLSFPEKLRGSQMPVVFVTRLECIFCGDMEVLLSLSRDPLPHEIGEYDLEG